MNQQLESRQYKKEAERAGRGETETESHDWIGNAGVVSSFDPKTLSNKALKQAHRNTPTPVPMGMAATIKFARFNPSTNRNLAHTPSLGSNREPFERLLNSQTPHLAIPSILTLCRADLWGRWKGTFACAWARVHSIGRALLRWKRLTFLAQIPSPVSRPEGVGLVHFPRLHSNSGHGRSLYSN